MSDLTVETDGDFATFKRDDETVHIMPAELYHELRSWTPTEGRMDLNEFVNDGYLHELNRQVLHPLGLALEVICDDGPDEKVLRFGGIHDFRDDPEGMAFGDSTLSAEKAARIQSIADERREARVKALGYWVQPIPGDTP